MSTRLCHQRNDFLPVLVLLRVRLVWIVVEFLQKWRYFSIIVATTRLFDKAECTISAKQQKCPVLVGGSTLRFENLRNSFHYFFPCFDIDKTLSWTTPSGTKDISSSILDWFFCLFKTEITLVKLHDKGLCLISKDNIADLTGALAFRTFLLSFFKWLKIPFLNANCNRPHRNRTKYRHKKLEEAFVKLRSRGECATHRNYSHLICTCLQPNIGFCRAGDLRDG